LQTIPSLPVKLPNNLKFSQLELHTLFTQFP